MDLFDVLTLIGGLSLFLFGMNIMGQALERRAGNSLKYILGKLTDNKFIGFLTGLVVTAVIQSSSATTVMVVGFVNSGLMTLQQSLSLIMGANVGTTITAWILSLTGISGGSFFLKLLKPSSFTPVLALIGVIFLLRGKNSKSKDTGTILLGFATLMFGLITMSEAVSTLDQVPAFHSLFLKFENPILGLLVGVLVAAIIQSSSASVGILQSFSLAGLVSFSTAIPMLMGMNIGASVPILISSIGTNKNAKRSALYYLIFNLIGAVLGLAIFLIGGSLIDSEILHSATNPFGIALVHTAYKLLCVLLIAPFNKLIERLICKMVPDSSAPDKKVELDERLLKAPALALERCRVLMDDMAKSAMDSITLSLNSYKNCTEEVMKTVQEKEDLTDHYEDVMGTYLVQLSGMKIGDEESMTAAEYLKLISDFERIADHSVDVVKSSLELKEKGIVFSDDADSEIGIMIKAINHITLLAYNAFVNKDMDSAFKVEPLEQVVDYLREEIRTRHISRLQKGLCSIEAGFVLNDLLASMECVSDHCSNIAGCVMDAALHNLNLHETLNEYKHHSERFNTTYDSFMKQYGLPAFSQN
ncbi:MAG: Na/Pi cotransporter family protein [Spirochaetales bacterium]|nr:Na/Pi cotransporter family protein [Spirochaetales bacterium]